MLIYYLLHLYQPLHRGKLSFFHPLLSARTHTPLYRDVYFLLFVESHLKEKYRHDTHLYIWQLYTPSIPCSHSPPTNSPTLCVCAFHFTNELAVFLWRLTHTRTHLLNKHLVKRERNRERKLFTYKISYAKIYKILLDGKTL